MARPVEHTKGPDGLPNHLKGRIVVRALAIIPGILAGLCFLIMLQQMGRLLVTPSSVIVAMLLGALVGILVPTLAFVMAAGKLNRRVAHARGQGQGHARGGA